MSDQENQILKLKITVKFLIEALTKIEDIANVSGGDVEAMCLIHGISRKALEYKPKISESYLDRSAYTLPVMAVNETEYYTCPKCRATNLTCGFSQQISTRCILCDALLVLKFQDYKFQSVEIHPPGPPNPPRAKWQECG